MFGRGGSVDFFHYLARHYQGSTIAPAIGPGFGVVVQVLLFGFFVM
tara:strand:- start:7773 stop:7910 length:138 start_codon:yes stop_codon:yes gene_type:complete